MRQHHKSTVDTVLDHRAPPTESHSHGPDSRLGTHVYAAHCVRTFLDSGLPLLGRFLRGISAFKAQLGL